VDERLPEDCLERGGVPGLAVVEGRDRASAFSGGQGRELGQSSERAGRTSGQLRAACSGYGAGCPAIRFSS
jgi:hypothetical protein